MSDDRSKQRNAELDAFWDIASLLPRKRTPTPSPRQNTEAVDVVIPKPTERQSSDSRSEDRSIPRRSDAPPIRRMIPPHTEAELTPPQPLEEYEMQDSLIHRVRLYRWKSSYHYYDAFVRDAERLLLLRGEECDAVPFFSYVPQYSQLSRAQLSWYLYWRDCFRHGEALPTDYSYLLLFVYELINLSGKTDAARTQAYLVRLWLEYRETYTALDSYLVEWICDYSLIHRLPPPEGLDGKAMASLLSHATLREFYITAGGKEGYVRALLAFCSNHHYRKSKFYTEEHASLFDRIIPAALREVIEETSRDGRLFSDAGMQDSRLLRDAYTGALCSYRFKRKIEVEFASFSRSHELRFLVTDIVKYTENAIRAHLGIRSRLSVNPLPDAVRTALDGYLSRALPKKHASTRQEPEIPAYEKLYDLPQNELSFRSAAEIERDSWSTTERLVGAFSEEDGEDCLPEAPAVSHEPSVERLMPVPEDSSRESLPENADGMASFAAYAEFLQGVLTEDMAGWQRAAAEKGMLPDLMVDRINELAADLFGDILLEEDDGGYTVLTEYRSLAEEILQTAHCVGGEE